MTDKALARRLVLVSIGWMAGVALYDSRVRGNGNTFKRMWGVGVIGLMLSLAADVAPQIAGPFAALTALGVTFSPNGEQALLNFLGGAVTGAPSGAATAHTGGTRPEGGPQK